MITFVTGGARSGKSRYALDLAGRHPRPAFIATAEPFDDEMRERIRRHREEREAGWITIEEPLDLAGALRRLPDCAGIGAGIAVVDCLTVWLGNLLHHLHPRQPGAGEIEEVGAFLAVLDDPPCPLVLVSNEVGFGGIAMSPLGREFTDRLGRLNQEVAARADRAVMIVSGLPLFLKGGP